MTTNAPLTPEEEAKIEAALAFDRSLPSNPASRLFDRLCALTIDPTDRRDPLALRLFNRASDRWAGYRWFERLRHLLMPDLRQFQDEQAKAWRAALAERELRA